MSPMKLISVPKNELHAALFARWLKYPFISVLIVTLSKYSCAMTAQQFLNGLRQMTGKQFSLEIVGVKF